MQKQEFNDLNNIHFPLVPSYQNPTLVQCGTISRLKY